MLACCSSVWLDCQQESRYTKDWRWCVHVVVALDVFCVPFCHNPCSDCVALSKDPSWFDDFAALFCSKAVEGDFRVDLCFHWPDLLFHSFRCLLLAWAFRVGDPQFKKKNLLRGRFLLVFVGDSLDSVSTFCCDGHCWHSKSGRVGPLCCLRSMCYNLLLLCSLLFCCTAFCYVICHVSFWCCW